MNISKIVHTLPRFLRRHKVVRMLLFLSPGSRIQLITFNDSCRLFVDISDPFARSYFFVKGFDPEFFSLAVPFLTKDGVFFDVGANFGFCSFGLIGCLAGRNLGYYLFEANADICRLLSQSAKLYPNQTIQISHCCVTDSPGVSKLSVTYNNFGSSFICDEGTQGVKNLLLDDYICERSIKKINFLKIDIEGWEIHALRGAMNSLKAGVIETIYIEVSTENLSRAGFSPEDCFALLRDCGFILFYVRAKDFQSGVADDNEAFDLDVNGYPLKVAVLNSFPSEHITDILAIHRSSRFIESL